MAASRLPGALVGPQTAGSDCSAGEHGIEVMSETVNTDEKQSSDKPWQFRRGQSGNPAGKPKGTRHKITLAVQALFDGEAEEISRKAIEKAKEGDMTAIRLVLERVLPARKDSPVSFDLPGMNNADDATKAMGAIMSAVANGDITPSEGSEAAKLVGLYIDTLKTADLEKRIKQIEEGKSNE
jgi:hypothetical protein